jgi:hypothetical protein
MKAIACMGIAFLFVAQLDSIGFGQAGIITTYVGPTMPADGSLAVSRAIDLPTSVAMDGNNPVDLGSPSTVSDMAWMIEK